MNTTALLSRLGRGRAAPASVDTGWLPSGDDGFIGASWFAPAAQPARRTTTAVLIVPGILHEQRTMFDGLAALARALAGAGFGSLLIDLHGCSQSSGRLDVADIGDRWRRDIRAAVGHLRSSGIDSVIVVGVRVGALLAQSALEGERLAGFVAWAPVLSGRRYVRELKLMNVSGAVPGSDEAGASAGGVSVGGHEVPGTVLTELAALSFDLQAAASRQPVLVLGEHNGESGGKCDAAPAGRQAEHRVATELQRWLFTPQLMPIVPQADIRSLVDWCSRQHPPGGPAPAHAARRRPVILKDISLACDGLAVRERAVRFGRAGLVGIVSEPLHAPSVGAARLLATLDGPGRLFPTLAREEAQRGKTSLRFEFAGFASSGLRPDGSGGELYSPAKRDDVAEAIGCLGRLGHSRVALVGFCAGAWSMIQAAGLPGVSGIVAINAQLYRQPDYRLRDIALRGGHPFAKALALARRMRLLKPKIEYAELRTRAGMETGRWLRQLGASKLQPLLIYSEDDTGLAHLDHRFGRAGPVGETPRRPGSRHPPGERIAIGRYTGLGHSLEGGPARRRAVQAVHTYLAELDARLGAEAATTVAAPKPARQVNGTRLNPQASTWGEALTWAHSR